MWELSAELEMKTCYHIQEDLGSFKLGSLKRYFSSIVVRISFPKI